MYGVFDFEISYNEYDFGKKWEYTYALKYSRYTYSTIIY